LGCAYIWIYELIEIMSKIGIACGRTKESISSEEIVNAVVVVRVGE